MSQNVNGNTINLSAELMQRVKDLKRDDQSMAECIDQVVSLGCYQLEYRRENADVRKAKQKAMREQSKAYAELMDKAARDPELSEKLGLGKRVAL